MMNRRVITGERDGRSVVLREDTTSVESIANMQYLWRCEETPTVPNDGEIISEITEIVPPVGGVSIVRWEVPPGGFASDDFEDEVRLDYEKDRLGFHGTDSVDVDIVLSGSVTCTLDDEKVLLNAGDVIVLNGNAHAWGNSTGVPGVILSVITGATRQDAFHVNG